MTPTWAELHEMEPGLRPDNDLVLEHGEWTLNPYYKEAAVDDEIAYSLCRDKAAEFIEMNARGSCWSLHHYDSVGWKWDDNVPGAYATRDEAIRAACFALIREKANG